VEAYQNMYYRLDANDEALQYRRGLNKLDFLEDDQAMEIFKHCAESTNSNPDIKLCSLIQIVFIRLRCGSTSFEVNNFFLNLSPGPLFIQQCFGTTVIKPLKILAALN